MKRLSSRTLFLAALALIVLANAALLAAAGWNRRAPQTAELALTERELALPEARLDESTRLELSLMMTHQPPGALRRAARWKRYDLPSVEYDWLDRAKLVELGSRIDLDPEHPDAADHYSHAMPRRVYLVLEHDGQAWTRWIAGREEQVRQLRREVGEGRADSRSLVDAEAVLVVDRAMRSRLYPVDAGLDADALQRRYGDDPRCAIFVGIVRPKIHRQRDEAPVLTGEIFGLEVSSVHVPHVFRASLADLLPDETWTEIEKRERREAESGWPALATPRYRAVLAVGRRHEPWFVGVARVEP